MGNSESSAFRSFGINTGWWAFGLVGASVVGLIAVPVLELQPNWSTGVSSVFAATLAVGVVTLVFDFSLRRKFSDDLLRFLDLNQTSFNGIYRANLNGDYNVPYGHRSKDFFDAENLALVSERLQGCQLGCIDFEDVIRNVRSGDLVFLDPPYTVSHNKNGFIKYNQQLFSLDDQKRLRDLVDALNQKGAYYILTNAAHATIAEIFSNGDMRRVMTSGWPMAAASPKCSSRSRRRTDEHPSIGAS